MTFFIVIMFHTPHSYYIIRSYWMRIDKFLSNLKYGSRKEIKSLMKTNEVFINENRVLDSSIVIDPNKDLVYIDGEKVFNKDQIHLMMYKPVGYLSANHDTM